MREHVDGVDGIKTPNGRYPALMYKADTGIVSILGHRAKLLSIAHPSKYSSRSNWPEVCAASKEFIADEKYAT